MKVRHCKDCVRDGITSIRNAPHPGPRCSTHWRAFRKATRARTAAKRVESIYGLTPDQFDALWAAQGRRCPICWRPVKVRRPQVDHDHDSGEVRGLTCKPCNYELLGRYDLDALIRAARYLLDPPAPRIIGRVIVPMREEKP